MEGGIYMKSLPTATAEDVLPDLLRMWAMAQGAVRICESSCGGIAVLLRQQGEMQLLQGFEALSEALFWLEEAVERSLRTLCIGVEPPD